MDTKKRRLMEGAIPGFLLFLACFGNLCAGIEAQYKTAKAYAAASGDLSCFVCNDVLGPCYADKLNKSMIVKCKDEYFQMVYGKEDGDSGVPLNQWPSSLSELVPSGTGTDGGGTGTDGGGTGTDKKPGEGRSSIGTGEGWVLGSFPSSYEAGKALVTPKDAHRFSGLGIVEDNKAGGLTLDKGFQSCQVMRISADSQLNGNQRGEISKTHPRIIRSCSFVDADSKKGKDSFDEKGCRIFNYKAAAVEVCYCKGDGCNGSSYLQVSLWMIAGSTLALLAQNF